MDRSDIKKIVLVYSGGLDTSVIIPWLKENYEGCEIIAVCADVGQNDEFDGLEEKALKTGACKLYVLDLTDEYVNDFIVPTLKAGANYEGYLLGTSHARPCIAKQTQHKKEELALTFAELVYNGQWYTPLRKALSAFVDVTQAQVSGKVRLKLYKGNIIKAGVWSPYSLYSEEIATFGESDYDQKDASGFIKLYGLPPGSKRRAKISSSLSTASPRFAPDWLEL